MEQSGELPVELEVIKEEEILQDHTQPEIAFHATNQPAISDKLLEEEGLGSVLEIRRSGTQVANPDDTNMPFAMSEIDETPKWTEDADRCLFVYLSGKGETGQPLSLLAHLTPAYFNDRNIPHFRAAVERFAGLTSGEHWGLIAGGNEEEGLEDIHPHNYTNMVDRLVKLNEEVGLSTHITPARQSFLGTTNLYADGNKVDIIDVGKKGASEHITAINKPVEHRTG